MNTEVSKVTHTMDVAMIGERSVVWGENFTQVQKSCCAVEAFRTK